MNLELPPLAVNDLMLVSAPRNVRRDLPIFYEFLRTNPLRRTQNELELPRNEVKKLLKLLPLPAGWQNYHGQYDGTRYTDDWWIEYLDERVRQLGWVNFPNATPYGFPQLEVQVQPQVYAAFSQLDALAQERHLLQCFQHQRLAESSEFYRVTALGRLDRFASYYQYTNQHVGVVQFLNLPTVRQQLLDWLGSCAVGVWFGVADFIAWLKQNHPYFLIPKIVTAPPTPAKKNAKQPPPPKIVPRYAGFQDDRHRNWYDNGIDIKDEAAFERVEGRYVERWLEGIPLEMGYVELAYRPPAPNKHQPSIGQLVAFRLTPLFEAVQKGSLPPATVTVQPNFEIQVEMPFYQHQTMATLLPWVDVLQQDTHTTTLKLNRTKMIAALNEQEVDVLSHLQNLSSRPLPPNVSTEIREWTQQASAVILYENVGVLEGAVALPTPHLVLTLADHLRVVNRPAELADHLQQAGEVLTQLQHVGEWLPLPSGVQSQLLHPPKVPVAPPKPLVKVRRELYLALHIPQADLLQRVQTALTQQGCPCQLGLDGQTLLLPESWKLPLATLINQLQSEFTIQIEETR